MNVPPVPRIAVATSFPPSLVRADAGRPSPDYDRLCVQSWLVCGFHVVGVNFADEIPTLRARHPEVEFVAVERSAETLFGRKTPFIKDLLAVLSRQPAPVLGIVNSDILFEPARSWHGLEALIAENCVVAGQRYDTAALDGGALHPYFPGFDSFFFGRDAAQSFLDDPRPFSMGLPWWDYWFPLVLALRGHKIVSIARPAVLHLLHGSPSEARSPHWRSLAREFALALLDECRANAPPSQFQALLDFCRGLGSAPEHAWQDGGLDEQIIHFCDHSVPLIRAEPASLDGGALNPDTSKTGESLFANLPDRIAAGNAFQHAMWEEKEGRFNEAGLRYRMASENAPRDGAVLAAYGNFLLRRGDLHAAVAAWRRAVALHPHSAIFLNSLGSALGQLDRTPEAAACLEKAVLADPLYGPSYFNLALACFPYGHDAVIRRLDEALARSPNFPEGTEWRRRILAAIAGLGRPAGAPSGPFPLRPGRS